MSLIFMMVNFEVLSRLPILVARCADLLAVITTCTSNVATHALANITTDTQEIKHTHCSKNTGLFCTRFTITVISVPYRIQTTTLNESLLKESHSLRNSDYLTDSAAGLYIKRHSPRRFQTRIN